MTPDRVLAALRLPPEACVDKRVPKTLLLENGAPAAADKKLLRDGIELFTWHAALKPTTGGPAAFRDDLRDYPEIAILRVELRPGTAPDRLHALIHRAIPYPCLLLTHAGTAAHLSLAHKRRSQGPADAWVTEPPALVALHAPEHAVFATPWLATLALDARPVANLADLYQGWLDALLALRAAVITGTLRRIDAESRHARLADLDAHAQLTRELAAVRAAAAKEKQMSRRLALAERRKSLERHLAALTAKL